MPELRAAMLPPTIMCPYCGTGMELDEDERAAKVLECPACKKSIAATNPLLRP
jgi:DNA-directed RNA polymerase subunit M/transcription elongation factor TFIIS